MLHVPIQFCDAFNLGRRIGNLVAGRCTDGNLEDNLQVQVVSVSEVRREMFTDIVNFIECIKLTSISPASHREVDIGDHEWDHCIHI